MAKARVIDHPIDALDGKIGEIVDHEASGVTLRIDGQIYRFAREEVEFLSEES